MLATSAVEIKGIKNHMAWLFTKTITILFKRKYFTRVVKVKEYHTNMFNVS